MAKLYFSIQHHEPRLLETAPAGPESYAHDRGVVYLVLHPFVLEPASGAATGDLIYGRDYLLSWTADTLRQGVSMPGPAEIQMINSGVARACPVPLPPGFKLGFTLSGQTHAGTAFTWSDNRQVGYVVPGGPAGAWDSLDGAASTGWPAFATLSNALPPVRRFADLDGGAADGEQAKAAVTALLGVFSAMATAWSAQDPPRTDSRDLVWSTLVKPKISTTPLRDDAAWRAYLAAPHIGGGTQGSWAFDLLLPIARGDQPVAPRTPVINLPAFLWEPEGVKLHPELFLTRPGGAVTERSYLDALWAELQGMAAKEKTIVDAAVAAGKTPQLDMPMSGVLGRLFGFGERLAWPIARLDGGLAGTKRIMALTPNLARVAGLPPWIDGSAWLATNVVSLAGLTLRIPYDPADPISTVTSCDLSIAGTAAPSPLAIVQEAFKEFTNIPARAPALASLVFGAATGVQSVPATQADRIVLYAPRKAAMPRLAASQAQASRLLYTVPEALLDVLDATARFSDRGLNGDLERNAPRRGVFRAELLDPQGLFANAVDTWHRRGVELTPRPLTGSQGLAYAMKLVEAVHPDEMVVNGWFNALATAAAHPDARLWVAAGEGTAGGEFLFGLVALPRDADGAILVLDPDPKAHGSLSELLGYKPAQPKAVRVDLVFRTTREASGLFDVLEIAAGSSAAPPDLALVKAPLTRLSRSVDRLAGAMAATWPVPFDPGYGQGGRAIPDAQAVEFAEANKLRLRMALPAGGMRDLSEPDAQLPLGFDAPLVRPWTRGGPVSALGPQAWYWLAEHFDQDTAGDQDADEETRFQLWNAPSAPIRLSGYLEHQFGHRVGVVAPVADLRRSVDVLNAADVMVPEQTGTTNAPANQRRPLLQISEDSAIPRHLMVTVRREALALALAEFNAATPGPLRDAYRALAELRDSMAAGLAELAIETWVYDNIALVGSGTGSTLASGMKLLKTDVVALHIEAGSDLERLLVGLAGSFAGFVAVCNAVKAGATPLGVLWKAPSSAFDATASLVRARLTVRRSPSARADATWGDGAFVPVADGGPAAGAVLADVARADLRFYLTNPDSRLTASVSWIDSADRLAETRGLGPGAGKFLAPAGETAAVDRVADFFYMPHAFVLPDAHAWLGDRRATTDFLGFLLGIVDDILNGRDVSDRLALEALGAADAVALRAAARAVLAAANGAIARMMTLFRRVDVRPTAPPADAQGLLHWHAGEVLDSLSALGPASPFAGVHEMLLDDPTLFSSLRAVAIGVFNRKLPRAPDPAPNINQSAFSPELLELALTKHLIDDTARVKADIHRFAAGALAGGQLGGSAAYYLLDPLPDHFYDDLMEIRPTTYARIDPLNADLFAVPRSVTEIMNATDLGDAVARRGEDLLRTPPDPAPRFAANAVHPFPDWRVVEEGAGGKVLRTYYLLPERVPPPQARTVDALDPKGNRLARAPIVLDFAGTGSAAPLPTLSPNGQWPAEYARAIGGLAAVGVRAADGSQKAYQRIQTAVTPTGPARYLPAGIATAGPRTKGWHLLTTYLSHFWFELDLQKPGENWSANLEEDTYELEVELWPATPPQDPPDQSPAPALAPDVLLKAFRAARPSAGGQPASPPAATRIQLQEGLDAWLRTGRDGRTLLEAPTAPPKMAPTPGAGLRTFRITRPVGPGAWTLTETTSTLAADGVGAVVGFEVMARVAPGAPAGPHYDAIVPPEQASVLIRIAVLDHPFSVSRVRLRVVRNWRDVGGDNIPDIAPDFYLTSRYSDWKSEGRDLYEVDEALFHSGQVPPAGRQLRASTAGALQAWYDAIDVDGASIDLGAALPATLNAKVFHNADTGQDETLWEPGPMMSAAYRVNGMVYRSAPDPSFVFGKSGTPIVISTRTLVLAGDPLGDLQADKLSGLLSALRPSRIKSDAPLVSVVWRSSERLPILKIDLPLNLKP